MADPVYSNPPPTGWDEGKLNELFAKLASDAEKAAVEYLDQHTPPYLQPYLKDYMDSLIGGTGGTKAVVEDGDSFTVGNVTGGHVSLAVANGAVTNAQLLLPLTSVVVKDTDAVVVHDAAGAAVAGSPGVAEVANGSLADVKLSV